MQHTGFSRSSYQREHAVIAPEAHVPLTLPGWEKGSAVYLLSPQMGAKISMSLGAFEAGGSLTKTTEEREIFLYVLDGSPNLVQPQTGNLRPGSFAFVPPWQTIELRANAAARVLFFEKTYQPLDGRENPAAFIAHVDDTPAEPFNGDPGALLQTLMPGDLSHDMAVNIFEFAPGGTLPQVEMHYMEHGLYFLAGQGVYRLGDSWYTVQKEDVLWMGPYCPQWFAATGKENSKYIYYKEANRDPHTDPRA